MVDCRLDGSLDESLVPRWSGVILGGVCMVECCIAMKDRGSDWTTTSSDEAVY